MSSSSSRNNIWKRYWHALGGLSTLLKDIHLYIAVGLTVLTLPIWLVPLWWDLVISVLSTVIGFSIGGFSVVLALSNERMKGRLLKRNKFTGRSPFLMFNSAFTHYILLGFLALMLALLCKAYYRPELLSQMEPWAKDFWEYIGYFARIGWVIAGFFFCYCLSSCVGAVFYIYRLAEIIQIMDDHDKNMELAKKDNQIKPD